MANDQEHYTNEFSRQIGKELRIIRIREDLSQQDVVARGNGFSRNTLIAMELGKYNFGVHQMMSVLDAMGYDIQFVKRPATTTTGTTTDPAESNDPTTGEEA